MKLYEKLGRCFLPASKENCFPENSYFNDLTRCFLYPARRIRVDKYGYASPCPFMDDEEDDSYTYFDCPSVFVYSTSLEHYFFIDDKWYCLPSQLIQAFGILDWYCNLYIFILFVGYDN